MRGQWIGICAFGGLTFKIPNGFSDLLPALCLRPRTAGGVLCLLASYTHAETRRCGCYHLHTDHGLPLRPPAWPKTKMAAPQPPRQRPPCVRVAVASAVGGRACVGVCWVHVGTIGG